MMKRIFAAALPSVLLLAGCASTPSGPSVLALPGTGRSFEQFRVDDAECRYYAQGQIGGTTANQSANNAAMASAAVGTAVGAVAGAAMGGHEGAGVGAGAGLLVGSMAGAGAAESSARGVQRQYDNAYIQCMYAKGNKVPVSAAQGRTLQQMAPPQPGASRNMPPPPPGE